MPRFKVGDEVRVVRPCNCENWNNINSTARIKCKDTFGKDICIIEEDDLIDENEYSVLSPKFDERCLIKEDNLELANREWDE